MHPVYSARAALGLMPEWLLQILVRIPKHAFAFFALSLMWACHPRCD